MAIRGQHTARPRYKLRDFEFCTDSGKPSGPYRRIKYKHGVTVTLD